MAPIRKFDSKNDYYKLLEVDDFASVKDMGIPGSICTMVSQG